MRKFLKSVKNFIFVNVLLTCFLTGGVLSNGIEINGVEDKEIIDLIKTVISYDSDYASTESSYFKLRFEKDVNAVKDVLSSFGYFDAEVSYRVSSDKIIISINLKDRYKFNDVSLRYIDNEDFSSGLKVGDVFDIILMKIGSYTDTRQISKASTNLLDFFKTKGFLFVKTDDPDLEINRENKTFKVIFNIRLNKKIIIDKSKIIVKTQKDIVGSVSKGIKNNNIKREKELEKPIQEPNSGSVGIGFSSINQNWDKRSVSNFTESSLEQFIRNRLMWKDGEFYDFNKFEDTKNKIMETSMFDSVDIEFTPPVQTPVYKEFEKPDKGPKQQSVPDFTKDTAHCDAIVTAHEAKLRNIEIGASYGSGDGFGGNFIWEHYNVDGKGSKFSAETFVSKKEQEEELKYVMPDFFRKRDELKNKIYVTRKDMDSYNVKKTGVKSMIWNDVFKNSKVGIGLRPEISKTKDKIGEDDEYKHFQSVGIPIKFNFDTTKNPMNPQSGIKSSIKFVPQLGSKNFTSVDGKFSIYVPMAKNKRDVKHVIACYMRASSLLKSSVSEIPRDKLLFRGGPKSVRAYDSEMLGELSGKKPLGGNSAFEFGIEPRIKVTENIGAVAFFEAGNVYDSKNPLMKGLLYGAGVGVRYYTMLGPLRVDVAFPFKKRKDEEGKKIDSAWKLYIGIGQAF